GGDSVVIRAFLTLGAFFAARQSGIAKRLRSNSGKTPVSVKQEANKKKAGQKRKAAEIDDSYFEEETETIKVYVFERRVAVERELSDEALEVDSITKLIKKAGLMKTVSNLGHCYEKLVKKFVVNIPEDCDNPDSEDFMKVFVRGKCVDFSPAVINMFLGRSEAVEGEVEITDNYLAKAVTAGQVKQWPRNGQLPSSKLSVKYACLNKIGARNWVPTVHTSDITT
ncbi:envelope-like protein, partial [Trifolium medium]|nr:envelope-like protein [Trifolium medium]